MIEGSIEVARGCYSSSPISDLILAPKLRGLHQSSSSRGSSFHCWMAQIIRNIFYNDKPKHISLTHSYMSQYGRGKSKFLIQIVALKTFEDIITPYLNLLFPVQRRKFPIPLSSSFYGKCSRHPSPLAYPGPPLQESQCIGDLHTVWGLNCTRLCKCREQINHLNSQMPLGDDRARTEPGSIDFKVPMVDGEILTNQ